MVSNNFEFVSNRWAPFPSITWSSCPPPKAKKIEVSALTGNSVLSSRAAPIWSLKHVVMKSYVPPNWQSKAPPTTFNLRPGTASIPIASGICWPSPGVTSWPIWKRSRRRADELPALWDDIAIKRVWVILDCCAEWRRGSPPHYSI